MKLDPTSLRLFIAVVEEGSIAKAAAREHLVSAAVSKRVAELETLLRAPLLRRTHRGAVPTDAGLNLLRLARHAIHVLDDTYAQMVDYAEGARGQIRVCANISAITQFLPDDLSSFAELYPQIQIILDERNSEMTTKAVMENAADVGILTMQGTCASLTYLEYERDQLVVVLRKDHPLARRRSVSFSELTDWDFVGLREGSAINRQLALASAQGGPAPRMRVQVTGFDALCLMIGAGMGIGVAPRNSTRFHAADLRLTEVDLSEPWANREIGICVQSTTPLSPATELLVRHLQHCAISRRAQRNQG